jgi:transglutaminase-like putative cysteine protease
LKRRDFLASTALFSLFAGEALADTKKKASTTKKKPAPKPKKKKTVATARTSAVSTASTSNVVHSADNPLIDNPPDGTSASRLPPVRAQELPGEWQSYQITTTLRLNAPGKHARLWIPLPSSRETIYQRTSSHGWQGNPHSAAIQREADEQLEVLHCEWPDAANATLQLVTTVNTADRHFDITRRTVAPDRDDILRLNLRASNQIPNDGPARELGERIVGRIRDPIAQVKAIYDWICEHAIYDLNAPGCGIGDINQLLNFGRYSGRSADINGLFVSICRSIGIPARCVFGIRTGSSRLFRSLGLRSEDASQAQHVRAEFYLPGYGWIPVNPSDVCRAAAYEVLSGNDARLQSLKRILFGVWEMNWVAFHNGTDVQLPGRGNRLPFFIEPELHLDGLRISEKKPLDRAWSISVRRIAS